MAIPHERAEVKGGKSGVKEGGVIWRTGILLFDSLKVQACNTALQIGYS